MFNYFIEYVKENTLSLDLGCNIARWYPTFKKYSLKYEGLDMSSVSLEIARERYPDITFYHMKAEEMVFVERYDLIFTNTVMQHISRGNQRTIFGNIHRALKPGGVFVMQEKADKESETHHTVDIWVDLVTATGLKFIEFIPESNGMKINGFIFIKPGV